MWRNKDCPCEKDCPDRWVSVDDGKARTCHGTCRKYKQWVENRAANKRDAKVQRERYCMTDAALKAYWNKCRRDSSKAYKKFSQ